MLCPERITDTNIGFNKIIRNEDDELVGEIEYNKSERKFKECVKEKCAAWDKTHKICLKQYT